MLASGQLYMEPKEICKQLHITAASAKIDKAESFFILLAKTKLSWAVVTSLRSVSEEKKNSTTGNEGIVLKEIPERTTYKQRGFNSHLYHCTMSDRLCITGIVQ